MDGPAFLDGDAVRRGKVFGGMDVDAFQWNSLLNDISENLGSDELKAMKFLCRDLLSKNRLDKAGSGFRLFYVLQEQGHLDISNSFIVAELLYRIRQFRLLKKMGYDKEQVCQELTRPGKAKISSYRQLLFEVSEDITTNDLETVKCFLQPKLSKSKLENIKTMLDALIEMEMEGMLEEGNTSVLEYICKQIGEDLVTKFKHFQKKGSRQGEQFVPLVTPIPETNFPRNAAAHHVGLLSAEPTGTLSSGALQNSFSKLSVSQVQQSSAQDVSLSSMVMDNSQALRGQDNISLSLSTGSVLDSQTLGCYKMESKPRGYCVIINNYAFQNMQIRQGTDKDAERLIEVFTWLGFQVEMEKDLSAEEMRKKVDEYSKKDHRLYDCFVCCILTHGKKGVMYGTDGENLAIREVTSSFSASRCQSLQQKPKVFFIQACQGSELLQGIQIEEDGVATELEEDAVSATRSTIPDEADFLLGMATVEGYVSFRHKEEGTWYIQSLCENLEKYCPREDLLSILTIVNSDVSKKMGKNFKTQMPQPSYTLRKKLYFPVSKGFADSRGSSS
ncbi:caspase-8-like isoform X2 [Narcine bancroftii]|uniref:caspase-8-like isoform X2 n=1 Tax=Narcine bancroftii TaxID=1343680 RepID=UPI0038314F37